MILSSLFRKDVQRTIAIFVIVAFVIIQLKTQFLIMTNIAFFSEKKPNEVEGILKLFYLKLKLQVTNVISSCTGR